MFEEGSSEEDSDDEERGYLLSEEEKRKVFDGRAPCIEELVKRLVNNHCMSLS